MLAVWRTAPRRAQEIRFPSRCRRVTRARSYSPRLRRRVRLLVSGRVLRDENPRFPVLGCQEETAERCNGAGQDIQKAMNYHSHRRTAGGSTNSDIVTILLHFGSKPNASTLFWPFCRLPPLESRFVRDGASGPNRPQGTDLAFAWACLVA